MNYTAFIRQQIESVRLNETRVVNIGDRPINILKATVSSIAKRDGMRLRLLKDPWRIHRIEPETNASGTPYRQFIASQVSGMRLGDINVVDIGDKSLTVFRATLSGLEGTYKTSVVAGMVTVERVTCKCVNTSVKDMIWGLAPGNTLKVDDSAALRQAVYHINKTTDRRFKFKRFKIWVDKNPPGVYIMRVDNGGNNPVEALRK